MADLNASLSKWGPTLLSVLRIVAAFLYLAHGSQKLFGFPPSGRPGGALPPLMMAAGIIEFFGGLLLLLGLFTRWVAFILSGQMAFAYFMSHAPQGFWPIVNRGELAALYCFLFLYFVAAGGGPWSLDQVWRRRR